MTTESKYFSQFFNVNPDAPVPRDFVGRTFDLRYRRYDLYDFIEKTGGALSLDGYSAGVGPSGIGEDKYESPVSRRSFLRYEVRSSPGVTVLTRSRALVRAGEWVSPWAAYGDCCRYEILLEPGVRYIGSVCVSVFRPLRPEHLGEGVVVDTEAAVGLDDGTNRPFFAYELAPVSGGGPLQPSSGGTVCYPNLAWSRGGPRVFLAGTSEHFGESGWREGVVESLEKVGAVIVSPRPAGGCDYGAETELELENRKDWERQAMDSADYILFNFVPGRESSVSLMELGLYASTRKLVVSCPQGYSRLSSVRHTCRVSSVPLYSGLDDAVSRVTGAILGLPGYFLGGLGRVGTYGVRADAS